MDDPGNILQGLASFYSVGKYPLLKSVTSPAAASLGRPPSPAAVRTGVGPLAGPQPLRGPVADCQPKRLRNARTSSYFLSASSAMCFACASWASRMPTRSSSMLARFSRHLRALRGRGRWRGSGGVDGRTDGGLVVVVKMVPGKAASKFQERK